jgi:hypothetical protein
MNIYCLLEESKNNKHLLGQLLAINMYDTDCTCIVSCTSETKRYILNLIDNLSLTIEIEFKIFENVVDKFNIIFYLQNLIKLLKYALKKYGSAIFIIHTLIMTNKFTIPSNIKEQGFGFVKKNGEVHSVDEEYKKYNFELFYLNNEKCLNIVVSILSEHCENNSLMEIDINKIDSNVDIQKKMFEQYKHIPYLIYKQNETICLFSNNELIATEDFFAFENSINSNEISQNWQLNDKPISFVNLRLTEMHKSIQQFNKNILSSLCVRNVIYMSIINLMFSNNKLEFILPVKEGVGIWDRTNANDSNSIYRLLNDISNSNKDVFGTVMTEKVDYFSFGNHLIYDKPSKWWLNNNSKKYSSIVFCNYDDSLLELFNSLDKECKFLSYIAEYPKILENYVKKNDDDDIDNNFIEQIKEIENKEVYEFTEFNTQILALCLALKTVPIIPKCVQNTLIDLEEGKHYLREWKVDEDIDICNLKENCRNYYLNNMTQEKIINKLMNHIFIRRI